MDTASWATSRLLTTAARLLQNRHNENLRAAGVTEAGLNVLLVLADFSPQTQAELARILRVQPQTMGRTIQGLERRGLIERGRDTVDRRLFKVAISAAGSDFCRDIDLDENKLGQALGRSNQVLRAELINIISTVGPLTAQRSGTSTEAQPTPEDGSVEASLGALKFSHP